MGDGGILERIALVDRQADLTGGHHVEQFIGHRQQILAPGDVVEQGRTRQEQGAHLGEQRGLESRLVQGFVRTLGIRCRNPEQPVGQLSGGNQQKVVIAKWLVRDCEVLFFDEPTRGIDVGAKSEIYKLLNTLAEQGRAIVMISSELPEVLRLSHRILVMCEGRITGELKAGEATQENIMQYATQRETTQLN